MPDRRETDKAPAKPASGRRAYEYDHEYGLRLKGGQEPEPPKRKPPADPAKKA